MDSGRKEPELGASMVCQKVCDQFLADQHVPAAEPLDAKLGKTWISPGRPVRAQHGVGVGECGWSPAGYRGH